MSKLILFLLLIVFISSCSSKLVRNYVIVKEVEFGNNFHKYKITLVAYYNEIILYTDSKYCPGDTIYLTKQKP